MDRLPYRIGTGYDIHRLVEGRPLWLGGIEIPFSRGLLGHSDADVLLHAISDALLGALALRDIGYHFPDTDPRYKGADSRQLLRHVMELIWAKGYVLGNLDAVVVAEQPKLKPHIPQMQAVIAELLAVDLDQVSLKASTNERLGAVGAEEGIMAMATVLLIQQESESGRVQP